MIIIPKSIGVIQTINNRGAFPPVSGGGGAWDLSSLSYTGNSFDIETPTSEDAFEQMYMSPNGTKMFVVGDATNAVYQFTLSTPWDVSSLSYDSKSYALSCTGPTGIFLSSDGYHMYIACNSNNRMYQYVLSTAWDVSTASTDGNYSYGTLLSLESIDGFFVDSTGTKLYMAQYYLPYIHQISLSSAWDLSSGWTLDHSQSILSSTNRPTSIFFSSDGSKMFVYCFVDKKMYQWTLSTPWDISTLSIDSATLDVSSQDTNTRSTILGFNGTTAFMVGFTGLFRVFGYSS